MMKQAPPRKVPLIQLRPPPDCPRQSGGVVFLPAPRGCRLSASKALFSAHYFAIFAVLYAERLVLLPINVQITLYHLRREYAPTAMCGREGSARTEAYIPKAADGEKEEKQQGNELPPPILFQPNLRHDGDNDFQNRFKHKASAFGERFHSFVSAPCDFSADGSGCGGVSRRCCCSSKFRIFMAGRRKARSAVI